MRRRTTSTSSISEGWEIDLGAVQDRNGLQVVCLREQVDRDEPAGHIACARECGDIAGKCGGIARHIDDRRDAGAHDRSHRPL